MHPPVYTAEQADKYVQKYQFARTKNLFLAVCKIKLEKIKSHL